MTCTRFVRAFVAVVAVAALLLLAGCDSVGKLQNSGDVQGLVKIAEKPGQDFTKVTRAVDAIGEIGDKEAVEVLIGWVSGDDDSLRTAAIPALGATGDPAGIEALVAEIAELELSKTSEYNQTDPAVLDLRALVIALGGIDDPRAAKALLAQVDAERGPIVGDKFIGEALAAQGDDIVPDLERRLAIKSSRISGPAATALYVRSAEDTPAVGKMLRSAKTQRIWVGVFAEGMEYSFEQDLVYALDHFNDRSLASEMLNSDDEKLEQAARDWAGRRGYSVQEFFGGAK
jgi:hypothetical protein